VVSVKVTSDVSALCNASNDMGAEVKSFRITASKGSYPPHTHTPPHQQPPTCTSASGTITKAPGN
jgi:hypothetical protein